MKRERKPVDFCGLSIGTEEDRWIGRLASGVKVMKEHIGSNFDDFLREESLLDVAEATANKRVIAFQIAQEMKRRKGDQVRDDESDED